MLGSSCSTSGWLHMTATPLLQVQLQTNGHRLNTESSGCWPQSVEDILFSVVELDGSVFPSSALVTLIFEALSPGFVQQRLPATSHVMITCLVKQTTDIDPLHTTLLDSFGRLYIAVCMKGQYTKQIVISLAVAINWSSTLGKSFWKILFSPRDVDLRTWWNLKDQIEYLI